MPREWCNDFYDSVLRWPRTQSNSTALLPCPDEIFGIQHETHYNVTRFCDENGTWAKANYTGCSAIVESPPVEMGAIPKAHLSIMYYMYWAGYCISLIFLLFALTIFCHYKSLWCLRNIIHTNLILCFVLHNLTWIIYALITYEIHTKRYQQDKMHDCFWPLIIIKYFIAAGFFWMFVEGVYLLISIMFSFYRTRIRFWMCASLGWGVPFLLVSFMSIAWTHNETLTILRGIYFLNAFLLLGKEDVVYFYVSRCWMEPYQLDFIFTVPVLGVLLMNVLFLMIIMYVVVKKLQITVSLEATRYKKAVTALFILCPLLGMNYVVAVAQTDNEPLWLRLTLSYYNTIMSSIQGSLVAIFFCFRNNEVRITVNKSIRRWRRLKHENLSCTRRDLIDSDREFGQNSPGNPTRMIPLNHRLHRQQTTVDYNKLRNVVVMDNGRLQSYKFRTDCT